MFQCYKIASDGGRFKLVYFFLPKMIPTTLSMYSRGKWQNPRTFIISQRARFWSGFWCSPLSNIKVHSHLVLYDWDPWGNITGTPCTPIMIIIHLCNVIIITRQYYYYEMLRHWEFTTCKLIMHNSWSCRFCVAKHAIISSCIRHYWRKLCEGRPLHDMPKSKRVSLIDVLTLYVSMWREPHGGGWARHVKRYRNGTQDH